MGASRLPVAPESPRRRPAAGYDGFGGRSQEIDSTVQYAPARSVFTETRIVPLLYLGAVEAGAGGPGAILAWRDAVGALEQSGEVRRVEQAPLRGDGGDRCGAQPWVDQI